jgi:16S rRNA (guanine527-N7)-methyltransferase
LTHDALPDSFSAGQREQIEAFEEQLRRFNQAHNLISRRTEDAIRTRHTLHSLMLATRPFPDGATVVDWGTGGGLPAIPLAIAVPGVEVIAVDAVRKKIRSVRAVARRIGLGNLAARHERAGDFDGAAHYSVSRATAPLADLWRWHRRISVDPSAEPLATPGDAWRPGLLALKGGDLSGETAALREDDPAARVETHPLAPMLGSEHFAEKCIVHVYDDA